MDKNQIKILLNYVAKEDKASVYMAEDVELHTGKKGSIVFLKYDEPEKKSGSYGDYEIHWRVEYDGVESLVYQKESNNGKFLVTTLEKAEDYKDSTSMFLRDKLPLSLKYSKTATKEEKEQVSYEATIQRVKDASPADDDDVDNDLPF